MELHIQLFRAACCLLILLLGQGCTSIKTTQLIRSADGKFSARSLPWATRGVPCKFKIETGVRARITETIFVDPASGQTVVPETRIYDLATEAVYADQVFMVHIPRPFAGTLDLTGQNKGYAFNEDGYLTKVGGSIDDTTVEGITGILGPNSLGGFIKKTSADVTVDENKLENRTRLVAVKEFSFADSNWHLEFNGWVNQFQGCNALCDPEFDQALIEAVAPASDAERSRFD